MQIDINENGYLQKYATIEFNIKEKVKNYTNTTIDLKIELDSIMGFKIKEASLTMNEVKQIEKNVTVNGTKTLNIT